MISLEPTVWLSEYSRSTPLIYIFVKTSYQTLGSMEPQLWKVHVMPMVSTCLWLSSAGQAAPLTAGQNHSYLPFPWPPPTNTSVVHCLALPRSHERSPRCLGSSWCTTKNLTPPLLRPPMPPHLWAARHYSLCCRPMLPESHYVDTQCRRPQGHS
jgi:hypothetical protein